MCDCHVAFANFKRLKCIIVSIYVFQAKQMILLIDSCLINRFFDWEVFQGLGEEGNKNACGKKAKNTDNENDLMIMQFP